MGEGGGDPRGGEGGGAGKQRQKELRIKYQMKIIDKGLTSQQWTHRKTKKCEIIALNITESKAE